MTLLSVEYNELTLHQNGGLSVGKIVKVNEDKIGIVAKIIGGG